MIAAIPISEKQVESKISTRFSRSNYFAIINTTNKQTNIIENPFLKQISGTSKIVLERLIGKYSVDTLIAFELGIKLQQSANQKGLQLILIDNINRTLQEILDIMN